MKFEQAPIITKSLTPKGTELSWGIQFENHPAEGKDGLVTVPSLTPEDAVFIQSFFQQETDTEVVVRESAPTRDYGVIDKRGAEQREQPIRAEAKRTFRNRIRSLGTSFTLALALSSATPQKGFEHSTEEQSIERVDAPPKVRQQRNADGSITYTHDLETTDIINDLTRGPISERMLAMCMRGEMASMLEYGGESIEVQSNRERIYRIDTRAEIEAFYKEIFPKLGARYREAFDSAEEFATDRIEWRLQEEARWRSTMSPKLYDTLWKMEIASGAPRIRWADEESEKIPGRESSIGTSSYFVDKDDSGEPVIYLDASLCTGEGIDTLVQEMAHAQGHSQDPVQFEQRRQKQEEVLRPKIEALNTDYDRKVDQYREVLYDTPGTEEYHAHKVVYPRLLREVAPLLGKDEEDEEIIVTVSRGKTER